MRTLRVLPLALLAAVALAGCDEYGPNTDTYGNVIDVVSFAFDVDEAEISGDGYTATFASDDIDNQTARDLIAEILDDEDVTTNGVVLVYAEDDLIIGPTQGAGTRWAALPYTEGFEAVDIGGQPYVDLTLTYTYSFDAGDPGTRDDGNLYFDVVSSADDVAFVTFLRDRLGNDDLRLKLVAIPAELFTQSGLRAADLRSYETVARTFALAE